MTAARNCPQCNKPLSSDSPQGLCAECLLKAVFAGQSAVESGSTALYDSSRATTTAPDAGTRLEYFGDYELLEEIARGGMGVVWKARQSSLNRIVALKMIRAGALASPDEVARFLREAEAAANLQHANIVAIHEVGEHGGQHYFSMDFVAGRDLGALVKDGPLPPQTAARYVKIIAEAIHFAHQRGTLHRDLKPQNVLIDGADQPRITDFGLAKSMKDDSRLTQSGVVMGSPSYMPPEQAAGRHGDVGPASDVYSLGAMLYELLTGRPPFRGATALATMREVMEAEPTALRRLNATIPPDLETICLKCLEKSPTARYPTARALAEELDRFLKGEPIHARPASTIRKTVSWIRRHPHLLAAVAALVMVSLTFGIFFMFEENAFLRAQQARQGLPRTPGPRHDALQTWRSINMVSFVGGLYLFIIVMARVRALSFKEMFDPPKQYLQNFRPLQPLGEARRTFAIGGSLVLVGCGIMLLVTAIQANVWEGESIIGQIFPIYGSIYFGLAMLAIVIRDYRLVNYGVHSSMSSLQLTEAQIEPIRRALEDRDFRGAVKCYREAAPDTGREEANQYVIRLWESLRAQYPGRFALPSLSLRSLNWRAMAICTVIEAAVYGAAWAIWPQAHAPAFVSKFACFFLFGMGMIASTRVKGLGKRMLLIVPTTAAMMLSNAIVPSVTDSPSLSTPPHAYGVFFGISLMLAGFTPRRRQRVSKS